MMRKDGPLTRATVKWCHGDGVILSLSKDPEHVILSGRHKAPQSKGEGQG